MIITIVMDQYGNVNNGTTVTAMRFGAILREHGHTVRILTCADCDEPNVYQVGQKHFPLVDGIIESQGFTFAKPDEDIVREAIQGADVVHFLVPFALEKCGLRICQELGVAHTAAFHCQPENITYTIHMNKLKFASKFLYSTFRNKFYRYFDHIHCPSEMIKRQLQANGYQGHLHVISNGVIPEFKPMKVEKPEIYKDRYVILMVGRYSREKRMDLLIKACAASKYADRIQLILCGRGPHEKALQRLAKRQKLPVEFRFAKQPELLEIINYSDLYVHASDAEIEAISCMEAFTCGLVPIISDSELSATNQFAQSDRCLFKRGKYKDLRDKIDWFIEHPEEKERLSKIYIEYAKQFQIENCVYQLEKVFEIAYRENQDRLAAEKAKNEEGTSQS